MNSDPHNDFTLRVAYLHNLTLDILHDWLPHLVTRYEVDVVKYEPPSYFNHKPEFTPVRVCVDFSFAGKEMGTNTIIHGNPGEATDKELVLHMIQELVIELQVVWLRELRAKVGE